MDSNQGEDISGHAWVFLFHLWSNGTCRTCLLAEGLEEAAGGRLYPTVPVLRLQLVRLSNTFYELVKISLISICSSVGCS